MVMSDRGQIYSVLLNFLGNSIKFSDKSGTRVNITAKGLGNGFHEFALSANGIGISEEYSKKYS